MSDIVEWLNDIWRDDDHERGCTGRNYECTCGFDARSFATAKEAAIEIERLRAKLAEARAEALEEAALECVRHAKSEMPITMWKWHPWIKGNLERVTSLNRKMRAKAFIRAAAAIRALKGGANG